MTRGGAMTGDDTRVPNIWPAACKKVLFDVHMEKETFLEARNILNKNIGKFPIYEMPHDFDVTTLLRSSKKGSTLENFLEC